MHKYSTSVLRAQCWKQIWGPEREWPSSECPGAQVKGGGGAGRGTNPWCIPFLQRSHNYRLCTHRSAAAKPWKLPPIPSQSKVNNLKGK